MVCRPCHWHAAEINRKTCQIRLPIADDHAIAPACGIFSP